MLRNACLKWELLLCMRIMIHKTHLSAGFVRQWKRLYVPSEFTVCLCGLNRCFWLCVSLYPCLCVFCTCVSVCVCRVTCISENAEGQVSVWFHVRVETQRLRLQPGSSVMLRRPQRLKFTLWRFGEGKDWSYTYFILFKNKITMRILHHSVK